MSAPLSHLRVVELCDELPVASCGRQFASWGADVVRLEPADGSALRSAAPALEAPDGTTLSLQWEYLTANKQLETFRPNDPRARDLIVSADVFLTDWSPERLAAAGLGRGGLTQVAPHLVILSFSDFGRTGPYAGLKATDLILQALTGYLSFNGGPGRPPLKAPANVVAYACGVSAFVGVLAALRERTVSGAGQTVEVAAMDAIASLTPYTRTEYMGEPVRREGGTGPPILPCVDGDLYVDHRAPQARAALLRTLDIPEDDCPTDPQDATAFLAEHTKARRAEDLFRALGSVGVIASLVRGTSDLPSDEHLRALGFFRDLDTPAGTLPMTGPPSRMSATPAAAPQRARPLERWEPRTAGLPGASGGSTTPLSGVRIVDLTQAWQGPYATMLLADLGADVIKIESSRRPDVWRFLAPVPPCARERAHKWNVSYLANLVGRGKRSLCLDLRMEEGRELFRELARGADLVMENYTPRVMERFGLAYETLRRDNPELVMVSFSGYGTGGPYEDFRAHGAAMEPISGWTSLFGYPDEPPMLMGEYPIDPVAGLQMAASALIGLLHRDRTGDGQAIRGSLIESAVGYIGDEVLAAAVTPGRRHPKGNRHRDMAPHGVFPCAGDDRWVAISVRDDADWHALRAVAGEEILDDPRFGTLDGRLRHVDELEDLLARWTREIEAHDVMERLQSVGVPAGVVQRTDEALRDEHLTARGWFVEMHHDDLGTHRYDGFPWSFSRTPAAAHLPPPKLGEHSADILRTELGRSADDIERLFEAGVSGAKLEYVPKEGGSVAGRR